MDGGVREDTMVSDLNTAFKSSSTNAVDSPPLAFIKRPLEDLRSMCYTEESQSVAVGPGYKN